MASAAVHRELGSWGPNKLHSDPERWVCIYPAYLNSKKTIAQGRIIPKEKAIENPTVQEMRDVLTNAGLNILAVNKMYPREQNRDMVYRGMVRVQLKDENGETIHDTLKTRKDVILYAAEMVPKLKSRQQKTGGDGGSQAQQGGGGKKKGGKKGKR